MGTRPEGALSSVLSRDIPDRAGTRGLEKSPARIAARAFSLSLSLLSRHARSHRLRFCETYPPRGLLHYLETAAKLLELLEPVLTIFSKCALKSLNNQADFDSAIRRVRSLPPQPVDIARLNRFFVPSFGNGGFRCPLMDWSER